jgi:hypothetical protein
VGLRVLVLAVDKDDLGLATWKSQLDQIGIPYDTFLARSDTLTDDVLVKNDGTGRYEAILLTTNALLYQNDTGPAVSALDATEWNTLWRYERTYQVRQVVLYGSFGTYPEDYCLREVGEDKVGTTAQPALLTKAGATFFDYLNPAAQIPIVATYVYRTSIAAECAATPLLTFGGDVVGVTTTSADGRERAALTFSSQSSLAQTALLGYGLLRWATHGVFLGEQRHWFNVDVDDWYNSGDEMSTAGVLMNDGYRNSGTDVANLVDSQQALGKQYPLTAGFKLNLAANTADADLGASKACLQWYGSTDALTSYTYCYRDQLRFLNHTYNHTELNDTDYATTYYEIATNLTVANQLGVTVPSTILKTPAYSGLGAYNPDSDDEIEPPTDFGLEASNPALLQAATQLGVKYLHGNMSIPSQRPACFNCGIAHPLAPNLTIVPDWPTSLWYFSTTPDEETYFYNAYYGPGGRHPYWPQDETYQQILDHESDTVLRHLMSGSAYSHTLHIGNARQYATGRSLAFDWINQVAAKYSALYSVPLRNPQWTDLAQYATDRTSHFAALDAGVTAVWDRTAKTVTVVSPKAGRIFLTGVKATTTEKYGTDTIATVAVGANAAASVSASARD